MPLHVAGTLADDFPGGVWFVDLALGVAVPNGQSIVPAPPADTSLTPRERDVLRLLVDGKTDREIADALFIGARTVRSHVASLLARLDAPTRTAAATLAVRRGLA